MNVLHPELSSAGPAVDAQWEIKQTGDGDHPPSALLITPDSSNPDRTAAGLPALYHYLPQAPLLARDQANRPVFALTLVLRQQPGPEDTSLEPLIERGVLAMTLTLHAPQPVVEELTEATRHQYQPLFARHVSFSLGAEGSSGQTLAEQADASGEWMALSANLGRDETLEVLSALQGGESKLRVNGLVTYRTASDINRTLVLLGQWEHIYEFLSERFVDDVQFDLPALRAAFAEMIQTGVISTNVEPVASIRSMPVENTTPFFKLFLRISTLILQRLTLDLAIDDPGNRYALRSYGYSGEMSIRQTIGGSGYERFVELSAPLQDILYGAFDGLDLDAFVRLVNPATGGGFGSAPKRVSMSRPKALRTPGPIRLAAHQDSVGSLSRALQPASQNRPGAQALLTSDAVQLVNIVQPNNQFWTLNDWFLNPGILLGNVQFADRNLPVVEDPAAPLWRDKVDANRFWYAPTFEIVQPELNADPAVSPFLFRFTALGHEISGQTGLDGTVQLTLRKGRTVATEAALQEKGNPNAAPVALTSLAVALDLPFRDEKGATRRQLFPMVTEAGEADTVRATLHVINDWVRMVYGALAFANFQTEPARIQISFTYEAYVPVNPNRLQVVFGGKIARIPILETAEEITLQGNRPYLSARDGTFHVGNTVLHFARENQASQKRSVPNVKSGSKAKRKGAKQDSASRKAIVQLENNISRDFGTLNLSTGALTPILLQNNLTIHPSLEVLEVLQPEAKPQYAVQTLGSTLQMQTLFPCKEFGVLYVQEMEEARQTIGCLEVLRLGQTEFKQYGLLPEQSNSLYRIYRSLQMSERFLVVPTAYQISRFGPEEVDKAYRPTAFLYSTIDPEDLSNSRCVIECTLQPDVPAYARRELADKLSRLYHRSPVIEYITEVESQVKYEWSLPSAGAHPIQPQATKLWDAFMVSLNTDVNGVPQLQAMLATGAIAGHVRFTLPDGTTLGTNLYLDLRRITGPWNGGPVETVLKDSQAHMTNQIERPVNVSDLQVYSPGQPMQTVQVDRSLKAGETVTISVPTNAAEVYPMYTLASGAPPSLEEIRSFIEDIHTNVIFLNQVNYAEHNLKELDITARLKDLPTTYNQAISESESISMEILLPLTSFLTHRVLQFQVKKTDLSDQVSYTPWLDWSLSTMGHVIKLEWSLIANSQA
jgi:hypothetical protein